jgi:hypothetical protein
VAVKIVTNQDGGIVGYATGSLIYHPEAVLAGSPFLQPARLSTTGGEPLQFYFSDRILPADQQQPFSASAIDKLGVSVSLGVGPTIVTLTFLSWGGGRVPVAMESKGHLLVGLGPPLGSPPHAVYVVSFTEVLRGPC